VDLHRLSADIVSFKADLVRRLEEQFAATSETIKSLETRIEKLRQDLIKEE
jgi:cell division protein FtsB